MEHDLRVRGAEAPTVPVATLWRDIRPRSRYRTRKGGAAPLRCGADPIARWGARWPPWPDVSRR